MPDSDALRPNDPETPTQPDVRVQSLFDHVPATVWMTDVHLRLLFIEGMLIRRLNVPPARLIGRTLPDLLLDGREDHPLIQGHLTAIAGHENTVRIEWGGDIYSAKLAPMRDTTGEITGVVGVQQIIGWMPEDEGTFRKSDLRLRRAVDENMVGIAFGNEDGEITDANDAFLQIAGYALEDLTTDGLSWPVLVPVELHQRQLHAIEEVKEAGRCTPFETQLIRKDGRRVDVLVGGTRLSASHREGVAFVLDISAAKRASQHLGAELASADALLDAATPEAAVAAVLAVLCENLEWQGAVWWQDGLDGPSRMPQRHGTMLAADAVLEEMARRSVAGRESLWSGVSRTLALPISTGPTQRALLLVSGRDEAPDTRMIATSRAIGQRLARFVIHR